MSKPGTENTRKYKKIVFTEENQQVSDMYITEQAENIYPVCV